MDTKSNSFSDKIEESFIAITLGLMTLITFANVIARYVFNSNILWGLEVTVYLFAWLVLIGASYGVKKNFHIGVDVFVQSLPMQTRKTVTILATLAALVYSLLLFWGAMKYWWPFATTRAFYETDDIPVPFFLDWLKDIFNDGEAYEKLPRFIPYFALPLGMGLMVYRYLQVLVRVMKGAQDYIIASHEVEELLEDANAAVSDDMTAKG